MTKKQYIRILNLSLLTLAIFLFFDALFHLSGLRTMGLNQYAPSEIESFARFFICLWASAAFLLSLLFFQARSKKNQNLIKFLAAFTFWHGLLLLFFSTRQYEKIWPAPAMYDWMPRYSAILMLEGGFSWLFSVFCFYGKRKRYID